MLISPSKVLPRIVANSVDIGGPDLVLYRRREAEFGKN
jgi:hypothetical protein